MNKNPNQLGGVISSAFCNCSVDFNFGMLPKLHEEATPPMCCSDCVFLCQKITHCVILIALLLYVGISQTVQFNQLDFF